MVYALIAALILETVVFVWLVDRLVNRQDTERARHRSEIADLLQRIQAPEVAVAQHAADKTGPDEPFPLSDEEAQDELERARAIERVEAMANSEAPWLS